MAGEEKSSIDRAHDELYEPEGDVGIHERTELGSADRAAGVSQSWAEKKAATRTSPYSNTPMSTKPKRKISFLNALLIVSSAFFLGSALFAAFFFFVGNNTVSSNNITFTVSGPTTIAGGDELELEIQIVNRNSVALENANLIIEYPPGTRSAGDEEVELPRSIESLGTLTPGAATKRDVRARVFGEENSRQNITLTLEYTVEGSNAIFYAETTYEVIVSTSPISLVIDVVREITSGQEVTFDIEVLSNSDDTLTDVVLAAEFPFGFSFSNADPTPDSNGKTWTLGELKPEEKRTITIRGVVTGENGDERIFRFAAGIGRKGEELTLANALVNVEKAVEISQAFLAIDVSVNGSTSATPAVSGGRRSEVNVIWRNNLRERLFNAEIQVRLSGSALDPASISPERGFYRSQDNVVYWNKSTYPQLAEIEPGETGRVSFSFTPRIGTSNQIFLNPELLLDVSAQGDRIFDQPRVPEQIESTAERSVRVVTSASLDARLLHESGPFSNSGPVPPRAEQTTTYTVVLAVENTANSIRNARVTATLPSYVEFLGPVDPTSEDLTYNPASGRVSWEIGKLSTVARPNDAKREVAFQVAITPSISQIDTSPVVLQEQHFEGFDEFAEVTVQNTHSRLTTNLDDSSDSASGRVRE